MNGDRDGRSGLRPSFHLYLLVFTLALFLAQVPLGIDIGDQTPLDSTAHLLLPAAATSLLYDLLYPRVVHSAVQYFATLWLLGVCGEMLWECVEFALDATVHTYLQADNADTMHDIIGGIAGAALGAGLRVWLWTRSRHKDAVERTGAARPRFYYRRSRDGGSAYQGLWVAGSAGRWCKDRHSSIAEAERCARDRWWRDRVASRPARIPRVPWRVPALGAGRTVALLGASLVIALAPSGYDGYLAWATRDAPPVRSTPTVSIAAAAVVPATAPPVVVGPTTIGPAADDPADGSAADRLSAGGSSADSSSADAEERGPAPDPVAPKVAASVPIPSLGTAIPVGPTPGFVVVAPNGRQAYVANRAAGVVTVVDTAVNRVTATIPVPAGPPQYLAFSPDGRTVYVSIWNEARTIAAIGVLDTSTNSILATVPVRSRPFLAAVTPDGRLLYVPNHDSGTVSVVDTTTDRVTAEIRVAAHPHSVAFSPDGRRAYTANHESNLVSVIDTATDTVIAEIPAQRSPHSLAVHPTRPLVADVNYDSDSVSVIDTDGERVVATVPVGHGPQDITWAPDGRFAYVTNVNADTVSVIDAASMAVTATIPTGDAPTSVAVLPDGRGAYVTNLNDGTLTVLNTAG